MIRNFLRKFMAGRNGPDNLSVATMVASLVFYLVYGFTRLVPFVFVSYALAILALFRMFSRNIVRRRKENDRFIRYWWPVKAKAKRLRAAQGQRRTHKFFKCPGCRNTLRVPKGKGKLQVTCPKCGERFIRKT